ncbi:hypothetical protein GCM10012320_32080 [Sinomonas cellulolyticus]|uniref:SRPBCC family protein n=1 Tax=Sinomonas cellulolyticus TaxID=2801916 RepID=A0ABS1JXW7_9MICC|nr:MULTISPECIES: SRPBCC family protein [Sinomonas]MBL0704236.1 SRPBCC family protein [Sinomonas cellulolyticus]GHG58457.1 hypothetical protein GCM10012320_32080 [Sinomonas sp. KCTC 49339]
MPTIHESVFVPVPPEKVFDFISDPANSPLYQAAVTYAELDGDLPIGVGSLFSGRNKILGVTFDWAVEVIEYDRPTRLTIRSTESQIPFTSTYALAPEGDGTRVGYTLDAVEGLGGAFGTLGDAIVTKTYTHQVRTDLATLAELLPAL